MSFLRGSANHVWCTTSVLGKGATGAVYQGVNKINGEPVAVKTFNQLSHMRAPEVQMREFEVLKKVKHKNIVKLLAIEEEQQESRGKVIVMELCTGGSLFNILDDPENTYGLEETEFLLVLDHLSSGMKHLRDNNLVHRDLKPGNIMKFICDDGNTVYKLTDFGAARELHEGQQFNSLYGTEEYLHPDLYERAVLRKPPGKTFGATVDLWSIGVTLYHVATGNLPFRPYGGRRNKETMYHITTKKESGVISGIQTENQGPISWSCDLPNNCQLSAGLKKIVTPLLAGLLEADQKRIWSFEKFFNQVTNVLSRRIFYVFHINRASSLKVYIHPDENYAHMQDYINEQTEIINNNQILLHKEKLFINVVGENNRAGGYIESHPKEPLILFNKENNNVATIQTPDLAKLPEFSNLVSVESDAALAKTACSMGYVCKRHIEKTSESSTLMKYSVEHFARYIKNELQLIHAKCTHLKEISNNYKLTAQTFYIAQTTINTLTTKDNKLKVTDFPDELTKLSEKFLSETDPKVSQVHQKNVVENTLLLEWQSFSKSIKCPAELKAPARAKTLVERLRDSWQHLVRDRATRSLSYNDEQFHVLERIKISETNKHIRSLLETECIPAYNQLADMLGDWYKVAQTIYLQTMILNKDVAFYESKLEEFSQNLSIYSIQYIDEIQAVMNQAKNGVKEGGEIVNKTQNRRLKNIFKEAEKEKAEIGKLLSENSDLMEQINSLIAKNLVQNNDE